MTGCYVVDVIFSFNSMLCCMRGTKLKTNYSFDDQGLLGRWRRNSAFAPTGSVDEGQDEAFHAGGTGRGSGRERGWCVS